MSIFPPPPLVGEGFGVDGASPTLVLGSPGAVRPESLTSTEIYFLSLFLPPSLFLSLSLLFVSVDKLNQAPCAKRLYQRKAEGREKQKEIERIRQGTSLKGSGIGQVCAWETLRVLPTVRLKSSGVWNDGYSGQGCQGQIRGGFRARLARGACIRHRPPSRRWQGIERDEQGEVDQALRAFKEAGNTAGCMSVLRGLEVHGVVANVRQYTTVISAMSRHGDWRGAQELAREMESKGVEADT